VQLIFIHGPAAVGKLTVGRELQALTGLRLFHNHLVVDTLLAVFPFGSDPFVRLREQVWLDVFREAAAGGVSLIFTFMPEPTVNGDFADRVEHAVVGSGGKVRFVELVCPRDEQERRIEMPSRAEFLKLRSLETFRALERGNAGRPVARPRADLLIDTGVNPPAASARRIADAFALATDRNAPPAPHPTTT
jgi:hypothetical protein